MSAEAQPIPAGEPEVLEPKKDTAAQRAFDLFNQPELLFRSLREWALVADPRRKDASADARKLHTILHVSKRFHNLLTSQGKVMLRRDLERRSKGGPHAEYAMVDKILVESEAVIGRIITHQKKVKGPQQPKKTYEEIDAQLAAAELEGRKRELRSDAIRVFYEISKGVNLSLLGEIGKEPSVAVQKEGMIDELLERGIITVRQLEEQPEEDQGCIPVSAAVAAVLITRDRKKAPESGDRPKYMKLLEAEQIEVGLEVLQEARRAYVITRPKPEY